MNQTKILENMCRQALSAADLKAIGKVRGFSPAQSTSPAQFENVFLSEIGLEAAFGALSQEEIACLHLLSREAQPVDIRYFSRLYKENKNAWNPTFTQTYSPIFKAIQHSLIRRGLLFVNEAPLRSWKKTVKMERWRFAFPDAFVPHIPAPFSAIERFTRPGGVRGDALRRKVLEVLRGQGPTTADKQPVALAKGRLYIGNRLFSVEALSAWQRHTWNRKVWSAKKSQTRGKGAERGKTLKQAPVDFTELVDYAFSRLAPDRWVRHEELVPLLRLFFDKRDPPGAREICELGWELGCLARYTSGGQAYYRPAGPQADPELSPQDYLAVEGDALLVDMQTIPYRDLERITAVAKLTVAGPALAARPDFVRLGRASEETWSDPLLQWLREHTPLFRQAMETIEARRGKQIVHDGLLLARVEDLSLRVAIQKAIPESNRMISLPNGYLAFPLEVLEEVRRLVAKSGFVVKIVEAS